MKILLATDGSDCGKAAINSVAERPWPEGSEVKIISATEIPNVPVSEAWALPDSYYKELMAAFPARLGFAHRRHSRSLLR